ncbi:hypothetical protein E2C01_052500 [Portunus trituberculatus]|uniref:Uncharacterized protein n=1 Tax=Portunus trituberculatus TaxID=210409 RepID=A0A5B7GPJ2_PORTR|nr:hypothetical protein [Portunus trituberculatus]
MRLIETSLSAGCSDQHFQFPDLVRYSLMFHLFLGHFHALHWLIQGIVKFCCGVYFNLGCLQVPVRLRLRRLK